MSVEDQVRALAAVPPVPPNVRTVIARGSQLKQRRRIRHLAISAAVAVVAVLAVPVISIGGRGPSSTSAASVFLTEVSAKAGGQHAADSVRAAFWYSESLVVYRNDHYTRESWLGHYSPGRLIQPDGIIGTTTLGVAVFPAGSSSLSWDQLLALPRNPDTLYDWLKSAVGAAGHDPDSEMFVAVGDLLRESPAPPSLRRALYLVAAKIPDVSLITGLHDSLGRPATAVSRVDPSGQGQTRYLVDPRTGAFLEEQDVDVHGGIAFQETLALSGPVASPTARP